MSESPEYQVLSVRINTTLRARLEQLRDFMSRTTREKVSTSDVAKQLLESARSDYWEQIELLKEPTQALFHIRKKYEAQLPVSRAEWGVLAHYVQIGQEAVSLNPLSLSSQKALLEAFQAIYELRTGTSDRDDYYIGNLPCRPAHTNPASPDHVRESIAKTLEALAQGKRQGSFVGRNLQIFLDEEQISGVDALNNALRPYWPALWQVAARGHYLRQRQPIRDKSREQEDSMEPALASVQEDGYSLDFARGAGHEILILLDFPEERRTMYPIGRYPQISEFRAMLATHDPQRIPKRSWDGQRFFGWWVGRDRDEPEFWFRHQDDGIAHGFTRKEWNTIRKLFEKAWQMPDLQAAWDALTLEYGEL